MRKPIELKVTQSVRGPDGAPVPLETLPPEEYARFCRWLSRAWLTALFGEEAEFAPETEAAPAKPSPSGEGAPAGGG